MTDASENSKNEILPGHPDINSENLYQSKIIGLVMNTLCNSEGYSDRREALVPEELSQDEFKKYLDWWWRDPIGASTLETLTIEITESISEYWPLSQEESLDIFMEEFTNWEDFLRELHDCNIKDLTPNSAGTGYSYFSEYVILNSMRISGHEDEFSENHDLILEILEKWFGDSQAQISAIFSKSHEAIARVFC